MHGNGWAWPWGTPSQCALAARIASCFALGADGVSAAHPGACSSRVTSSRQLR